MRDWLTLVAGLGRALNDVRGLTDTELDAALKHAEARVLRLRMEWRMRQANPALRVEDAVPNEDDVELEDIDPEVLAMMFPETDDADVSDDA